MCTTVLSHSNVVRIVRIFTFRTLSLSHLSSNVMHRPFRKIAITITPSLQRLWLPMPHTHTFTDNLTHNKLELEPVKMCACVSFAIIKTYEECENNCSARMFVRSKSDSSIEVPSTLLKIKINYFEEACGEVSVARAYSGWFISIRGICCVRACNNCSICGCDSPFFKSRKCDTHNPARTR